jgi:hypothetical protein
LLHKLLPGTVFPQKSGIDPAIVDVGGITCGSQYWASELGTTTLDEAEVVSALTDSATVATTSGVLTLFLAAAAAAIGVGLFRLDDRLNCADIAPGKRGPISAVCYGLYFFPLLTNATTSDKLC